MPKCPNCGLEAQRTEDWACQWCGYPLLSPGFKKIDKTWKKVKEERDEVQLSESVKPDRVSRPEEKKLKMVPETRFAEEEEELPPVKKKKEIKPVPEMEEKEEIEEPPPPVVKPKTVSRPVPQPQPAARKEQPATGPEPAPEISEISEQTYKPESEVAPVAEPSPESVTETAMELTVDELLSAYMVNDVAAHERFSNRVLRVAGTVNRVAVNDTRAVYSVFLTGKEIAGFRDVECRFTKQYAISISRLKAGEPVTIQGRYFGYVINIILRSSVLVE